MHCPLRPAGVAMMKSVGTDVVHVYVALSPYHPAEHREDRDAYMVIEKDDILEVHSEDLYGSSPNQISGLLTGINMTRGVKGLFPGSYVRYLGVKNASGDIEQSKEDVSPIPHRPTSTCSAPKLGDMPHMDDSGAIYCHILLLSVIVSSRKDLRSYYVIAARLSTPTSVSPFICPAWAVLSAH